MRQPVVVGAFPEPFLHGWDGKRRPVEVRGPPELEAEAAALLETLGGARGEGEPNVFELVRRARRRGSDADRPARRVERLAGRRSRSPARPRAVEAAARALAASPELVRFRYEARFDEEGRDRRMRLAPVPATLLLLAAAAAALLAQHLASLAVLAAVLLGGLPLRAQSAGGGSTSSAR